MEWIKCSERMPEHDKWVLVFSFQQDEIDLGCLTMLSGTEYWDNNHIGYNLDQISHWAPLPKKPKAKSKE